MPPNLIPRREPVARFQGLAEDRPPDIFALDHNERSSHLWLKLKKELNKRLQEQREANDGNLDPELTARVRGHIDCLKGLLALADEPPTLDE